MISGRDVKQSTVIFGALIAGFVIFVTVRGDLPLWFSLFTAQGKANAQGAGNGDDKSAIGSLLDTGKTILGDAVKSQLPGGEVTFDYFMKQFGG